MTIFEGIASRYDWGMLPLEWLILRWLRRKLYPQATGRVLELGVGTGVNLAWYEPSVDLVAVDFSASMLQLARQRACRSDPAWVQADALALPFADGSFDHVVASLFFCSIADPPKALSEVRRVLCPGGRLLLLEHVRGKSKLMARLTDWLDRPWHRFSRSCHLNRETAEAVEAAGFELTHTARHGLGIFQTIVARNP
jgi:ubiquinone/menaquinone biosynthesis C-methylase UbiE